MTTTPNPWHARAEDLADWALARFFVRRDRYGGYYRDGDQTRKCARPRERTDGAVTRGTLLKHFRATRTDDVCGAYSLSADDRGRCAAVDIDAHDATADPGAVALANSARGLELYARLVGLGFRPLLARWGGSVHLYALFAADQPGAALHQFGRALVGPLPLETYPKQPSTRKADGTVGYGNWLRVVGRHHTRDQWAEVYDGRDWLSGAPAVAHLLTLTGDEVTLESPHIEEPTPPTAPQLPPQRHDPIDVLADFNRGASLDEVVGWHEAAGHRVVRRGSERVELVRAGKRSGESFNVAVRGGVALTYCFSTSAGLPSGTGLNPAQVRCWYECGRCDAAALCALADRLRAERGLPPRAAKRAGAPAGSVEERLAALEAKCVQLEAHNKELAREVLALRRQSAIGGHRVRGT